MCFVVRVELFRVSPSFWKFLDATLVTDSNLPVLISAGLGLLPIGAPLASLYFVK